MVVLHEKDLLCYESMIKCINRRHCINEKYQHSTFILSKHISKWYFSWFRYSPWHSLTFAFPCFLLCQHILKITTAAILQNKLYDWKSKHSESNPVMALGVLAVLLRTKLSISKI